MEAPGIPHDTGEGKEKVMVQEKNIILARNAWKDGAVCEQAAQELCFRAGLWDEWESADLESLGAVVGLAADKLGVADHLTGGYQTMSNTRLAKAVFVDKDSYSYSAAQELCFRVGMDPDNITMEAVKEALELL